MSERWYRWYDGTVRDGKFRIVAEISELPVCTIIGIWASLLEDAATSSPRGAASKGVEFHSMFLGIANYEIETVWNAMERVGLTRNGEKIFIVNWDRRQFETDDKDPTAKARKDKWKLRHRTFGTQRNAAERIGTPETETETETETDIRHAPRSGKDENFKKLQLAYPKRRGGQGTAKAKANFERALKAGVPPATIIDAARKFAADNSDKIGTEFIPMMATWLYQRRWEDYATEPIDEAAEAAREADMAARGYVWNGEKWVNGEAQASN